MCDVNYRVEGSKTSPRPRWGRLYLIAGLMLGVLLVVQRLVPAGAERTALQSGLVPAGFAAMTQWARRNRAALDHLDWCDCASSRVTVRVVSFGRQTPALARSAERRSWIDAEPAETLEEITR
jgi:hypothetical protein